MSGSGNYVGGLSSPPARGFIIAPDDQQDLARPIRGLMVAVPGDVALVTEAGDEIILPGLLPGIQYAIRAKRISESGTTADGLVGLA